MTDKFASPLRLRDGRWGVRVSWDARPGEVIDVRSVTNKIWQARIVAVLWKDRNDGSLVCVTKGCKQRRRSTPEHATPSTGPAGPPADAQLGETLPDGRLSAYVRVGVAVGDLVAVRLEDGYCFLARVEELEVGGDAGLGWTCVAVVWTDGDD